MKLHEIIPGRLYQRGLVTEKHIPELRARGVRAIVALAGSEEPAVRRWIEREGGRYVYLPVPDGKQIPNLESLAASLAQRLAEHPVLVHCRAGRNRSGLLAALIVRLHYGWDGETALLHVQERRPNALANEYFCTYLRSLGVPGKLTPTTTEVAKMSEAPDPLEEAIQLGLVDDGDGIPELTTQDPEERETGQLEIQPAAADGRTWNGADQLRPYLVRIEDLKPTPGNPDKGKQHVSDLMGSLTRFGQTRAILTDATDGATIRAGHHLTRAATELGWTHIAAIAAEFNDEGEAIAYLMADNRLARIGDDKVDAMQQLTILEGIGETNLTGTGWDLDAVETLRSEAGATPVIVEQEPWGGEAAETAEEAAARAAALSTYEPHKEIPLYMTLPQHEVFSEHVRLLQGAWSLKGVMDTILRALAECYEREAAPVSEEAASTPPEVAPAPAEEGPKQAALDEQAALAAEADGDADDDFPL